MDGGWCNFITLTGEKVVASASVSYLSPLAPEQTSAHGSHSELFTAEVGMNLYIYTPVH